MSHYRHPIFVDLDAAFIAWWQQQRSAVVQGLRREIPRWGDAEYPWDDVDPVTGARPLTNWRGNLVAAAVIALAALAAAGVAWLAWWLIGVGIERGGAGLAHIGRWPLAQVVLDPVQGYLQANAAALPASAGTLYTAWLWSIAVLVVLASVGSIGARVGWVLLGVMSTGMVWVQTPAAGQWIAAGVTVLWWAVLSVPALARYRPFIVPITSTPDVPAAPAAVGAPPYR